MTGLQAGILRVDGGIAWRSLHRFPLSSLDGSNGFVIEGESGSQWSGYSVSGIGDFNGDTIDDILIGAPRTDSSRGHAYVVFGRTEGFSTPFELSSLDGSNGFELRGVTFGDNAGFSVSNAGDVNGDNLEDLIIGAPFADPTGVDSGQAYVVFGRSEPFTPAPFELSSLEVGTGSEGFVINGIGASGAANWTVSNAGDVNGDGYDDVIIGAPNDLGAESAQAYVVFGRSEGTFPPAFELSEIATGCTERVIG